MIAAVNRCTTQKQNRVIQRTVKFLPFVPVRASLFAAALGLLAIELAVIQIWLRVYRALRRLDIGRNPAHRAQNHQFRVALLRALALEEIAEDRDITQFRYLI